MVRKMPVGVKILSILLYVGAGFSCLLGLLSIFVIGSDKLHTLNLTGIVFGIYIVLLAILDFFIARGFWKGQNWSRFAWVALGAYGIIRGIVSSGRLNVFTFGLVVAISLYLFINEDVKKFFSK